MLTEQWEVFCFDVVPLVDRTDDVACYCAQHLAPKMDGV
jgi:hypothetical protein